MLTEQEVLDFCNTVRTAGGADILDSLLPGIPLNSQSCLIANNLNFDCRIEPEAEPDNFEGWNMILTNEVRDDVTGALVRHDESVNVLEIAEKISEGSGMFVNYEMSTVDEAYITLDSDLAEVAYAFDNAHETYASYRRGILNAEGAGLEDRVSELTEEYNEWYSEFEPKYLFRLNDIK